MKHKTLKLVIPLIATVLLLCLFTGCGTADTSSSEQPEPTSTAAKFVPFPEPQEPDYQKIQIDFAPYLTAANGDFATAIQTAIDDAADHSADTEDELGDTSFRIVINIPKDTYTLSGEISLRSNVAREYKNIEIEGNGSTIISTNIHAPIFSFFEADNICVNNLSLDYDPLPFTQGIVAQVGGENADGSQEIKVKVDTGYRCDQSFADWIRGSGGDLAVLDRQEQILKPGYDGCGIESVQPLSDDVLNVKLTGTLGLAVDDVVTLRGYGATACHVLKSGRVKFSHCNLYASPGAGMSFEEGFGQHRLDHCNIIPGPKPEGASEPRLCCTNSDGTGFCLSNEGPIITNCHYKLTMDDASNIGGDGKYVVYKLSGRRYYLSMNFNYDLGAGDEIGCFTAADYAPIVDTTLASAVKFNINEISDRAVYDEIKDNIDKTYENRATPSYHPDILYDVTFENDIDLDVFDVIATRSRSCRRTVLRNNIYDCSHRVMLLTDDAIVENCTFKHSKATALLIGGDPQFFAERPVARNTLVRNNAFDHCMLSDIFNPCEYAFATIFVGTGREFGNGAWDSFGNKNITIEGNTITNSYGWAMQIMNADGITVRNNKIGDTFIWGETFNMGEKYGLDPDSAIVVIRTKNARFTGNDIATGKIAKKPVAVDDTCEAGTVWVE